VLSFWGWYGVDDGGEVVEDRVEEITLQVRQVE